MKKVFSLMLSVLLLMIPVVGAASVTPAKQPEVLTVTAENISEIRIMTLPLNSLRAFPQGLQMIITETIPRADMK